MLKTAYGFIEARRKDGTSTQSLTVKVVDFERPIEVARIGHAAGEDAPFEGAIYAIFQSGNVIPFIAPREDVIARIPLSHFNSGQKVTGTIPVIVAHVTAGLNLKALEAGPRSTISYRDCFPDQQFHGYAFASDSERTEALSLIRQALPLFRFDDYECGRPTPAICISVAIDGQIEAVPSEGSQLNQRVMRLVEKLAERQEHAASPSKKWGALAAADAMEPLKLELISSLLLDMEREIFFHGQWAYPHGIWQSDHLRAVLERSYKAHYMSAFPSFAEFLLAVITILSDRVTGRRNLEEYGR